ncbi:MAG: hypothetical protein XU08_C0007G0024 [candidate division WWE3 bacterium CSP1-7]|uniref:Uncharacterized protein n=1 Tax=candidate division WWE3 bacterium CSP1-7 TaxID=1576480 RepID=A0A0T5ZWM4_UNCKA|nr:MAG: hypothetical protein XU08_C0007G0024 [candidate division WWE3 bacterium CSP1-7]
MLSISPHDITALVAQWSSRAKFWAAGDGHRWRLAATYVLLALQARPVERL